MWRAAGERKFFFCLCALLFGSGKITFSSSRGVYIQTYTCTRRRLSLFPPPTSKPKKIKQNTTKNSFYEGKYVLCCCPEQYAAAAAAGEVLFCVRAWAYVLLTTTTKLEMGSTFFLGISSAC